eukprot:6456010-Pyramimonas_sp.AAC.1
MSVTLHHHSARRILNEREPRPRGTLTAALVSRGSVPPCRRGWHAGAAGDGTRVKSGLSLYRGNIQK